MAIISWPQNLWRQFILQCTYSYILWCIYSRRRERVVGWPASAWLRLVVSTRRVQRRHPHSTTASINNDNIPPTTSIDRISSTHLHHPVESYTVIICQQSYSLLFGIPSPTRSFIPGLKPSFSANPSHRSPSFFFFGIPYMDSPYQTVYCYLWAYLFSTF